jgi:apolipoprotein N-acyltransferase
LKQLHTSIYLFILPLITGLLLAVSTLPSELYFLNFIAFVPLLFGADYVVDRKRPFLYFLLQLSISLLAFYMIASWWVFEVAGWSQALGLLIILPFLVLLTPYIIIRRKARGLSALYFVLAWMAAETLQAFLEFGSPFYNLGHALGAEPGLIQWYEYTGASGGSLWVLAFNVLLYQSIKAILAKKKIQLSHIAKPMLVLALPALVSLIIFRTYHEKGSEANVLIVHPSLDCYDEKYQKNIYELMDIYLGITRPHLSDSTDYVVFPETAITNGGWTHEIGDNLVFEHFRKETKAFPNVKLISGSILYERVVSRDLPDAPEKDPGLHFSKKYGVWYKILNAAVFVERGCLPQWRGKEGLVPYQEFAPYPRLLPTIEQVGFNVQFAKPTKNRDVFVSGEGERTAALICYELVHAELFAKTARNGAEAFFVLLNEGWYAEADKAKKQFLQLSVVRAIENRRCIAHTSNMGNSAFIDQRGTVLSQTSAINAEVLMQRISLNSKHTVASYVGTYLGWIALAGSILLFIRSAVLKKSNPNNL